MQEIVSAVPSAEVSGEVGRGTSFEISVNGHLIFSKLKLHGFPDSKKVVEEVRKVAAGGKADEITDSESPGCNLL
ncbi:hypothetical protein CHS0354_031165 [Potamilus streckersoni]|uniref:Migration and invasion enhancer 1 n=1 Tax=Potamilus streckersoni TaxID=2493646 RepID=A0AAE0TKI4_9BIVA|nr:hypothetical protein CHS0354_031165 [Potamilus streckersoni]